MGELKRFDFLLKRKALPLAKARTRFALGYDPTESRNAIMSDNWITIVPQQPNHIPAPGNIQAAEVILRRLAPEADELEITVHEHVQFFDCGANLETVSCPQCHTELDLDWWGQNMSADFTKDAGFRLDEYTVPCCSSSFSLAALKYHFHQAFGRFALDIMNPNIGVLSVEDTKRVEEALGCDVSVVYQRV